MFANVDPEDAVAELKKEFVAESQRLQKHVHGLTDYLTAISGYAQILQSEGTRSAPELQKIVMTVEKSVLMLRFCIAGLKELERRYA